MSGYQVTLAPGAWLTGLFKDAPKIVAMTLLTFLAASITALAVSPSYTARTSLLVLLSSEYSYRPDVGSDARPNAVLDREAFLRSEVEILTSPSLEMAVLEKIGASRLYPNLIEPPSLLSRLSGGLSHVLRDAKLAIGLRPPALRPIPIAGRALELFAASVSADADKAGNIITLTVQNKDPALAAEAANTLVSLYLTRRAELYQDVQSRVMADQVAGLRRQLDTAQADYAAFKAQAAIADYETQRQILLHQQGALAQDLQQADSTIAQATSRLATVEAEMTKAPRDVVLYSDRDLRGRIDALTTALQTLKIRAAALRQSYLDGSPQVRTLQEQIRVAQAELAQTLGNQGSSAVRSGRSALYDALELDRANARQSQQAAYAQHDTDMRQLAAVQGQVRELASNEIELQRLDRERTLLDQTYRTATKALDERRILEAVSAKKDANVRVIQPAEIPLKPVNLQPLILAAGAMLALFVGVLVAVLSEIFRRGYLSPDAIEHGLGVPVLVTIGDLRGSPHLLELSLTDDYGPVPGDRTPRRG